MISVSCCVIFLELISLDMERSGTCLFCEPSKSFPSANSKQIDYKFLNMCFRFYSVVDTMQCFTCIIKAGVERTGQKRYVGVENFIVQKSGSVMGPGKMEFACVFQ